MSAPALDVDWESVKAHAITHGVREAARAYRLKEDTVKRRCSREGWLKPVHSNVPGVGMIVPIPASIRPIPVPNVPKASVAARNTLQRLGERTKTVQARAVLKGSRAVARMPGEAIVDKADKLKALVDSAAKLYGTGEQSVGISISVAPDESRVVDVHAQVTQLDQ